jgi:rubrerythrin
MYLFQDVNRNNVINYTEFLAACLETQGTIEEYRLAEAFDQIDEDDSGFITAENLRRILGENGNEAYIEKLMSEADYKKDGRISYEEFLHVFSEQKHDRIYSMYERSAKSCDKESTDDVLKRFGLLTAKLRKRLDSATRIHRRAGSTLDAIIVPSKSSMDSSRAHFVGSLSSPK